MEGWKKFAESLELTNELMETYYQIRQIFQREGWSDDDLIKPPYYPNDLMRLFGKFSGQKDEIFQTIRDYGFNVDNISVTNYIQSKLKHIDEITPLN